jgi:hypothetical protein
MRLMEKKVPRILRISRGISNDDDSLADPGIFALSKDLKCALCGRTDQENTNCHKFMNHVIGDALMKAHPRETSRIIREHKQFVTIGPRGTPHNNGERTDHRPSSAIRMVAAANDDVSAKMMSMWVLLPMVCHRLTQLCKSLAYILTIVKVWGLLKVMAPWIMILSRKYLPARMSVWVCATTNS